MTSSWLVVAVLALCVVVPSLGNNLPIPGVVLTPGRCPTVTTKQDFELTRYLGTWYSYQQFDAPFQYKSTCVRARYSPLNADTISVINDGYTEYSFFGIVFGREEEEAVGTATLDSPGRLNVRFGGGPDEGANYLILDTDYDNYALIYSCSQLWVFKFEIAWVLTRNRGERPSNLQALEQVFTNYGTDIKNFKVIKHNNCLNNN